jgi:ATP-binding cassette subfamily B protein
MSDDRKPRERVPLRQAAGVLMQYLRPQLRWVLVLLLAVFVTIALRLAAPQVLRSFIDTATAGGGEPVLIRMALYFFALAVGIQGFQVLATYLGENVAWRATNALRMDLLAHTLDLDATFHKEYSAGQLIERIDGDVETLSNFFSRFVIDVLGNGILVGGIIALLVREDWRIGLPIFAFSVLTLVVLIWIRKLAIPFWTKMRRLTAEYFGFLGEQLAGTEDIRSCGAVGHVIRRFFEFCRGLFPVRLRAGIAGYGMWMANIALFAIGHAIAFGISALLWRAAAISLGTVYLVFYYTELLAGPISEIRTQITDLQRAEAGIRRVRKLLATESLLDDKGERRISDGSVPVAFEAVSFAYRDAGEPVGETATFALRDVTFELPAGQVLGLLGRTGSGKSTLARLLVRMYDADAGSVLVDGHPVAAAPLEGLRRSVRLVPQEVQLFRASIRDNVRLFDPAIPDARIIDALRHLGLAEWVLALPEGLDTTIETGGLSAGQGQLLALARAFLASPGVVILDEASSRLDPATEALLERAMDRLLESRTAIIIAHRLSTVERADRILILEGGRVLESGARVDLLAESDSHLNRLLRTGLEEVLA